MKNHQYNHHRRMLKMFTNNIIKNEFVQNCFSKDDIILLGLSGGKDSLLLLEGLGELSKTISFKIIPVHVKSTEIGYNVNIEFLDELCKEYGLELRIIETEFKIDPESKKGPCFVCSWHRRKVLFATAKELNCNKIALGHHMDDAVQTLLLNMIYHGSISSMPSSLSMFHGTLELIRPLLFIDEKDIIEYQNIRNYPKLLKDCPYGDQTKRNIIRDVITELEKFHPQAKANLFRAMSKIFPSYLPHGEKAIINGLNVIHPTETSNLASS